MFLLLHSYILTLSINVIIICVLILLIDFGEDDGFLEQLLYIFIIKING